MVLSSDLFSLLSCTDADFACWIENMSLFHANRRTQTAELSSPFRPEFAGPGGLSVTDPAREKHTRHWRQSAADILLLLSDVWGCLYPLISPLTAMSNLKTSRLWCMQVPSIMHVVVATNPQQESWKLLKEMYYLTIHSSPHEFPYFHRCFLQTCAKWFIGVNRSVSDHFSWGKGGLWRAAAVPPGSGCCIHSQTYLCKKRWRYRILCRIKRNRMENRKIFLFYLCPTPVLDWRTRLFSWFCLFTAPLSKNFIPATYSLVGETNKKIHVF